MASGTITVVGLGPGSWNDVTLAARTILLESPAITFRTLRHPTVVTLHEHRPELAMPSFDSLYEGADNWNVLYATMAELIIATATAGESVVYAVPGHPLVGESSVSRLIAHAKDAAIPVTIIAGLSFLEPICAALTIDPIGQGLQILDATDLAALTSQEVAGRLTTVQPLLVSQVYNRRMASATKLALLEVYPPDWIVTLVQAAGLPEERLRSLPLSDIDHDEFADHLTSLYVAPVPAESLLNTRTPEALRYIVSRLRGPNGCPWDQKQTHVSLAKYVLEEAAEVADAIDESEEDPQHLAEELGDILLQVYLHAEIAQEEEVFNLGDILESITTKLIRRHPHVFGTVTVDGAEQVVQNWEVIKKAERANGGDLPAFESRLRRIVRHAPSLSNAHEIQRRAVEVKFDWPTIENWQAKLAEEAQELVAATTPAEQEDELGDLLFTVVALARRLDINAEVALRKANEKYRRRFYEMERMCHERGTALETLDRDAQVALWQEAKVIVAGQSQDEE